MSQGPKRSRRGTNEISSGSRMHESPTTSTTVLMTIRAKVRTTTMSIFGTKRAMAPKAQVTIRKTRAMVATRKRTKTVSDPQCKQDSSILTSTSRGLAMITTTIETMAVVMTMMTMTSHRVIETETTTSPQRSTSIATAVTEGTNAEVKPHTVHQNNMGPLATTSTSMIIMAADHRTQSQHTAVVPPLPASTTKTLQLLVPPAR